jgi:protease-4
MASLAASGGYYVAMPGRKKGEQASLIYAERTTLTGSIGVFASFPDVSGLLKQDWLKIDWNTIKQGEIKDAGSPFKKMEPKERQVWQDMVDDAYNQFLDVVEKGRPGLKGKLLDRFEVKPVNAGPPKEKPAEPAQPYTRYRADGGIFTAARAKELGLIDEVGTLDDAVDAARKEAELPSDCKVVRYERVRTLAEQLFGLHQRQAPASLLEPERLRHALTPRLWYLAPGHEVEALLATPERE